MVGQAFQPVYWDDGQDARPTGNLVFGGVRWTRDFAPLAMTIFPSLTEDYHGIVPFAQKLR